ncbi:unnamed protein product (macronuclear) [Paramecium tetraurelia]|uniref:Uncharacterized protein n=1 Tax=Paramecium tetraurelia TaxID=5888 RepID=A0CP11_PARTE|nr:uncharacterized protein GSPATT00038797001 [Paramecium tetraurelia]CAK72528.1 unnamed protein product [Paramecium tetraurelia]|eukprot:XP_001439925.1 hypothetical protein (macronuclear) [Paramecium tetraurelia strain d4-2]
MSCQNEQSEDMYRILALSKDVEELVFSILIKIFKTEKIQDCLQFLQQDTTTIKLNNKQYRQKTYLRQIRNRCQMLDKITLRKQQLPLIKLKTIILINRIILQRFMRKLNRYQSQQYFRIRGQQKSHLFVHLTALDDIQCGSNSLHMLVEMKVDQKTQSFENIKIKNT